MDLSEKEFMIESSGENHLPRWSSILPVSLLMPRRGGEVEGALNVMRQIGPSASVMACLANAWGAEEVAPHETELQA